MTTSQTEKTKYVIIRDKDGNEFSFSEDGLKVITDQLILTVLGEIKDELKKLNFKHNLVWELDKLDAKDNE
jgi:hypothetical protein